MRTQPRPANRGTGISDPSAAGLRTPVPRPEAPARTVHPLDRVRSVALGVLRSKHLIPIAAQWLIGCALLWRILDLGRKTWSTPFMFEGDTPCTLAYVGALLATGWIWNNPLLGAPYGLPLIGFPSNNNVDYAVVWLFARLSSNPAIVLNLAWLFMFLLGAAAAYYCLYILGIRRTFAVGFGIVYAFVPSAFYRSVGHFNLTFYLVPFACAIAMATGAGRTLERSAKRVLLAACVLIGLNYVYMAAFSILAIAIGSLIGFFRTKNIRENTFAFVAIALICITTVMSLAPSVAFWLTHGRPYQEFKMPAEAEIYGLRIRQIIGPVEPNIVPVFNTWLKKTADAAFPNGANEAQWACLGIVPSLGFMALLGVLLFSPVSRLCGELAAAARLNAAFLFIATVGGFGVLFNLLLYAGLRCYNRTSVFIAFFSIFAVAAMIDGLFERAGRSWRPLIAGLFGAIVLIAAADQGKAGYSLTYRYDRDDAAAGVLADTVSHIERLCATCSVYQLPETPFPQDYNHERMSAYDHGRAHVYSRTLRWSWPAFGRERVAFGEEISRLAGQDLVAKLRPSFRFIWVDRFGYADRSHSPEPGIANVLGGPVYVSRDARFAVYDLQPDAVQVAAHPSVSR